MKNMIERYVYDVVRRLPESSRLEVEKELRANIDDMLGKDHSEEHIEEVLLELGEPRLLANGYKTKERYLISPAYFDDYVRVLKIVMVIFVSVSLVFGAIDLALNLNSQTPWEMIGEVFSRLFGDSIDSILMAFAWVTVIFWIIERADEKTKFRVWKLSNLPEVPKKNSPKINRTGAVIGLILETIFAVIFIILLISYRDILGIYENSNMVAPMFTNEVLVAFIPLLIISIGFSVFVSMLKALYGVWSIRLTAIYTVSKIFSVVVTIIFISYPNLFNILMFEKIAEYMSTTSNEVADGFALGIKIFIIVLIVGTSLNLITTWVKTLKGKQIDK
ncbi:MAG: hypothetical protein KKH01_03755 [Firmicutes bacterium]|nr:hypothetical protein [Bacillota bacterium]